MVSIMFFNKLYHCSLGQSFIKTMFLNRTKSQTETRRNGTDCALVLRLGNFHTQMSFLGCIDHLMRGTGLQAAFKLVYAENAVVHILNGKVYLRAVRAHLLMDTALSAILTSGAFHLPWILIHHQANDALLGDESDNLPTLMDTSVAEVFDMEEIGLLNTDAMAKPFNVTWHVHATNRLCILRGDWHLHGSLAPGWPQRPWCCCLPSWTTCGRWHLSWRSS